MKKNAFIWMALPLCFWAFIGTGCTDEELASQKVGDTSPGFLPPAQPNDSIQASLFDVINLDYPGLEKVKQHFEANEYYYAAYELLNYYRNRATVTNPEVDLLTPSISAFEQNVADQALKHRFYIRNFKESVTDGVETYYSFDNNGKINWGFRPAEITDQEFRSQLHRHQWMLPQAKAYRVSKDERYVRSWISVYKDWMNAFPYKEGVVERNDTAWYGLQPTERATAQMDIMPYVQYADSFTPQWLSAFLTSFSQQIESVRQNYFTDGSNIQLSQEQTVARAGLLMPEMKNADSWVSEGIQRVNKEVVSQFLEDGVQNELDVSYHIGVIDNFYSLYKLAQANSRLDLFPDDYTRRLKNAAGFVTDIIYPDYSLDNFNDTRSSSYTKNVLIKNLKKYVEMFPEDSKLRWLATEGKAGTKPAAGISAYKTSGYYVLRNGWDKTSTMMVLKNNYNPDDKWHCQPDNGTFGLYHNGRNFFPDAGVYSYGGSSSSNADRNTYRATKNHNTMTDLSATIDGTHMKGECLLAKTDGNTQIVVTQNQSYANLTHRRAVFFVNGEFFVIVDEGFGNGNKDKINLNFHLLSSDNEASVYDDLTADGQFGAHTAFSDNNNMLVRTFAETSQDFAVSKTTSSVSNKLGEVSGKRVGYQYTIRKPSDGAARFITVIYPFGKPSDAASVTMHAAFTDNEAGSEGTFHEKGAAVKVTINGKTYNLSYTL